MSRRRTFSSVPERGLASMMVPWRIRLMIFLGILGMFPLVWAVCGWCLRPDQVLVVANRRASKSVGLAYYYIRRRHIPQDHLIRLWVDENERCTRDDFDERIAAPIRRTLTHASFGGNIRCLLLLYGIPLKVAPPRLSSHEKELLKELRKQIKGLETRLSALDKGSPERDRVELRIRKLRKRLHNLSKTNQGASVDSELTLVLEPNHRLEGWIPNPFFVGFRKAKGSDLPRRVLLVSRLDGPTPETVRRLVDDALEVERKGLHGVAYFDARWPLPDPHRKLGFGYGFYDKSIHLAAELVKKRGRMSVVLDERSALFGPGACPDAALYCGWYSLAHYVPAFTWVKGAVGYHIASGECSTLHHGGFQGWCKRMLEEGVAVTLGPVAEPYVQAFPVPQVFFGALLDGRWTVVESYFLALPYLSWQMVLVGDPLYRPFPGKGS